MMLLDAFERATTRKIKTTPPRYAVIVSRQNPHYMRDEKITARKKREFLIRKIYAAGLDVTMSLNMKIQAGIHDVEGEVGFHPLYWCLTTVPTPEHLDLSLQRM